MSEQFGLLCGFFLDGKGGGKAIEWSDLPGIAETEPPPHWLHLDRHDAQVQDWLRRHSGIDPLAIEALLAEETRPRFTAMETGAIVNLRGINPSPDAEPEDMVSVRIWIEKQRVVSVRLRALGTAESIRAAIDNGTGPKNAGDVVIAIAHLLTDRMDTVILDMEEALNAAGERSAILQDAISNRLAEQSNHRLFLISIIAGVFLPLTFVTGLLGINVSGIPGADSGLAFTVVCGLLLLIGLLELWLFRRLRRF